MVKSISAENIRNFALAGHSGSGKTAFTDLLLYKTGAVQRRGDVDQGNSASDYRPEEQERGGSIYTSLFNTQWQDKHLFFADTPGYGDFFGEAIAALQVCDATVIFVDVEDGINSGTLQSWRQAKDHGKPCVFFVNGLDRESADFETLLGSLQNTFGANVVAPFTLPLGQGTGFSGVARVLSSEADAGEMIGDAAAARESLMDTAAESDDQLMEQYLEGQQLSEDQISKGLQASVREGNVVPLFVGSVKQEQGIDELLNGLVNLLPDPLSAPAVPTAEGDAIERSAEGPAYLQVFKSVTDPYVGQLTYFRVFSGQLPANTDLTNVNRHIKERVASLFQINGHEQTETDQACAGQIVAAAKLKDTHLSDTLSTSADASELAGLQFPAPVMSYAVSPETKGEEEKVGSGLSRLAEEDPTLQMHFNQETRQTVLSGMGEQHLQNVLTRLEQTFKVKVQFDMPKVPYRETIKATAKAQYRHKKQSGGHGQFAEVHLRLEPLEDEQYEFANEVVGGNIPKNYIPAVEKGVQDAMTHGPLARCRVMNVRAVVYDGKYHPVDSSDLAFQIAGRNAFYDAMNKASPLLLEPIMRMRITFPEEYMGDVSGDLNSRRGRIMGMDREEGFQVVHAEAPMAETFKYATQLRSLTQGRGNFEMQFERYDIVPSHLTAQIQEEAAREDEE